MLCHHMKCLDFVKFTKEGGYVHTYIIWKNIHIEKEYRFFLVPSYIQQYQFYQYHWGIIEVILLQ